MTVCSTMVAIFAMPLLLQAFTQQQIDRIKEDKGDSCVSNVVNAAEYRRVEKLSTEKEPMEARADRRSRSPGLQCDCATCKAEQSRVRNGQDLKVKRARAAPVHKASSNVLMSTHLV